MELTVKKAFIDKNDKGKIYKVGETLHTDELNRVNDLVARARCGCPLRFGLFPVRSPLLRKSRLITVPPGN